MHPFIVYIIAVDTTFLNWCQTLSAVKFIEIVVTYSDDAGDIIH